MSEEAGPQENEGSITGPVIELETIDDRHGLPGLLKEFGTKLILRLSLHPIELSPEITRRAIVVDRIDRSGKPGWKEIREIGWSNLPDHVDDCYLITSRVNDNLITEHAAIGAMALLINELDNLIIKQLLPIGSGGDYLVGLPGESSYLQVEVSGIKTGNASKASSRLREKRDQIGDNGFVSVTTFQYSNDGVPHSYLHFVTSKARARGSGKTRGKGKKRK